MDIPWEKVPGKGVIYRLLAKALRHGVKKDCDLQPAQLKSGKAQGMSQPSHWDSFTFALYLNQYTIILWHIQLL